MIFQRGNPLDFERWAADPGMANWSYAHCLPYFKKMENCLAGPDEWRGGDGPLELERGPATNPLFEAFFQATEQAGWPRTTDVNGFRQEGFAKFDRNVRRGRRLSAARAYLHPVMHRPNLTVRTMAFTRRVLTEGTRAVGVEYEHGIGRLRRTHRVMAGEVVLCGGAINSPQLLQLSGIGNAAELRALGIDVVHDLPAVGEHLQDHLEVYVQHRCTQPISMAPALKWRNRPWIGANWLFFRKGPGATNHFEGGGFVRSNDDVEYPEPDVPLPADRGALRRLGARGRPRLPGAHRSHVLRRPRLGEGPLPRSPREAGPALQLPLDRAGPARVGRGDPGDAAHPRPAGHGPLRRRGDLARAVGRDRRADPRVGRRDGETALHPSCTCRMGTDADSVIHPDTMRVHGIDGLRVVDASAMRYVTNGNIYAPVMMLAEKAADLILGNTPLAPQHAPFHRHRAPAGE